MAKVGVGNNIMKTSLETKAGLVTGPESSTWCGRTQFCDDCLEITVSSTGGTADHQPQALGKYTRAGSLWENMIPFWKSEKNRFLTPDANSNPILFYIQWVVGGSVGSYDPGTP